MTGPAPGGYHADRPVALVIGCGDLGMGAARALGLNHPLVLVDVDAERLERSVAALRGEGYGVTGRQCDITSPDQVGELGQLLGTLPGVRVLAHVAGVGVTVGSWRKMMAVDLLGPHLIARAVHPHMVRGAAAIFVSSIAGYLPEANDALDRLLDDPLAPDFFDALVALLGEEPNLWDTYNYAKLGMIRMAENLAIAWGKDEVRALSLSPGMIDTTIGRVDGAHIPSSSGAMVTRSEKVAMEIPLARQGRPLEITGVLAFLASDAAAFINGIDVLVDGGHRAKIRRSGIATR